MNHNFIDRYAGIDSLIHRLDPRTKLVTTLGFVLAVNLTPIQRWPAFALYFALIAVVIGLSRLPILFVLRRSLVIIPFVFFIAVFNLFFKQGEQMAGFDVFGWHLSITREGLDIFSSVMAKACLSILGLILLSSTTALPRLLKGLEQLGLPRVLVMILSFMYRYLFVLADEVLRMKQARDSRSFGARRMGQIKTVGNMIGTLFIRSYERAERVYAAMLARGFEGRMVTSSRLRLRLADVHYAATFSIAVLAIALFPY
ncbi:MAG: cobalt ECF transporter T component CbiQ [Chloroflexi bacterium]|nr:cobalt ECF transporter T component CbiQ [Chloroflexota bacterium]